MTVSRVERGVVDSASIHRSELKGLEKDVAQTIRQLDDDAVKLRQIHSRLSARLDRRIYELWFAPRHRLSLRNGCVVVRANSEFELGRIRRTYGDVLLAVLRECHIDAADLIYEIADEIAGAADGEAMAGRVGDRAAGAAPAGAAPAVPRSVSRSTPSPGASHPAAPARRSTSLEQFCFGSSNSLLQAALHQLTDQPGRCTPLFLYGPTGSGKTHVLEGVVSRFQRMSKFGRCTYLTAEEFTNSFVEALRGSGLTPFRRLVRETHLIALDDVQFLSGKRATVAELQHTLDHLTRRGRQVVLASDRPPSELHGFGDEFLARLTGGLICPIEPADREVRKQLIERGTQQRQLMLFPEMVEYLADRLPGDARRVQGALNRLQAIRVCRQAAPTMEDCRAVVREVAGAVATGPTLSAIEEAVCAGCGIEPDQLRSERRTRRIASARMLAMWLARRHTSHALSEIGEHFGGRSHSAVIAAQKKVELWLAAEAKSLFPSGDGTLRDSIERIERQLRVG